jgi:hypothetical protein
MWTHTVQIWADAWNQSMHFGHENLHCFAEAKVTIFSSDSDLQIRSTTYRLDSKIWWGWVCFKLIMNWHFRFYLLLDSCLCETSHLVFLCCFWQQCIMFWIWSLPSLTSSYCRLTYDLPMQWPMMLNLTVQIWSDAWNLIHAFGHENLHSFFWGQVQNFFLHILICKFVVHWQVLNWQYMWFSLDEVLLLLSPCRIYASAELTEAKVASCSLGSEVLVVFFFSTLSFLICTTYVSEKQGST